MDASSSASTCLSHRYPWVHSEAFGLVRKRLLGAPSLQVPCVFVCDVSGDLVRVRRRGPGPTLHHFSERGTVARAAGAVGVDIWSDCDRPTEMHAADRSGGDGSTVTISTAQLSCREPLAGALFRVDVSGLGVKGVPCEMFLG